MPAAASPQHIALRLLARREHSRAELQRKLAAHDVPMPLIDQVLRDLAAQGLQSDLRFACAFIHAKRDSLGAARLRHELQRHGIDAETIRVALEDELAETSEIERARAIWEKKFGQAPATLKEKARQLRFMYSRGFDGAILGKLLQWDNDLLSDNAETQD